MNTKTTPESDPPAKDDETHTDKALDEALRESFPASDPVAIAVPKPSSTPL